MSLKANSGVTLSFLD